MTVVSSGGTSIDCLGVGAGRRLLGKNLSLVKVLSVDAK